MELIWRNCCEEDLYYGFFSQGRDWSSFSYIPHINPDACHALPGAVFHQSKMRAHVAADAGVITSGYPEACHAHQKKFLRTGVL